MHYAGPPLPCRPSGSLLTVDGILQQADSAAMTVPDRRGDRLVVALAVVACGCNGEEVEGSSSPATHAAAHAAAEKVAGGRSVSGTAIPSPPADYRQGLVRHGTLPPQTLGARVRGSFG